MIRSNIHTDNSDFDYLKTDDHINAVWNAIEKNVTVYFQKILDDDNEMVDLLKASNVAVKPAISNRQKLSTIFKAGIEKYSKDAVKYRSFFAHEKLHEYEDMDNPKPFKTKLSSDVPLIRKALQSKYEAMKDWQQKYSWAKATDIYAIFVNLIVFMDDYCKAPEISNFGNFNDIAELDRLTVFSKDEDYSVPGVVGAGIQSSVLYFLNPKLFLCANKNTLYGLHFLSDCSHFDLPSGSNEFIMINDEKQEKNKKYNKNLPIDQNYWYPYDLFIFYGLRTYRLLKELCGKEGFSLDDSHRFIYVNTFMSQIWDRNIENIKTMTGGDQDREEAR